MHTLIDTTKYGRELTQAEAHQYAPSIFTSYRGDNTSERYQHFSTKEVLHHLSRNHFATVGAQQGRARLVNGTLFNKHQVTLVHRSDLGANRQETPRIILTNSHDGTTSFTFRAGLFLLVCSNGLVVSDGFCPAFKVRHTSGHLFDEVLAAANNVADQASRISERVVQFKDRVLTVEEARELATKAVAIRYGDEDVRVSTDRILEVRRSQDSSLSLWHVFNRVQENLIKGGFQAGRIAEYNGRTYTDYRRAKGITAIDESTRINSQLWALADTFLNN